MNPSIVQLASGAMAGAVFSGLIGLIVHWSSGRREAKRWRLDLKYKAYLNFINAMEQKEKALLLNAAALKSVVIDVENMGTSDILFTSSRRVNRKIARWLRAYEDLVAAMNALLKTHAEQDVSKKVIRERARFVEASMKVNKTMRQELELEPRWLWWVFEDLYLMAEELRHGRVWPKERAVEQD